jgi:hypothetical protein
MEAEQVYKTCFLTKNEMMANVQHISQLHKFMFYKAMCAPLFLCKRENYAVNRIEEMNTEIAKIRFLRKLAGYTL